MLTTAFSTEASNMVYLSPVDIAIIKAIMDTKINISILARNLQYDPSTVHYHIGKIRDLTGYDIRKVADAVALYEEVKHL